MKSSGWHTHQLSSRSPSWWFSGIFLLQTALPGSEKGPMSLHANSSQGDRAVPRVLENNLRAKGWCCVIPHSALYLVMNVWLCPPWGQSSPLPHLPGRQVWAMSSLCTVLRWPGFLGWTQRTLWWAVQRSWERILLSIKHKGSCYRAMPQNPSWRWAGPHWSAVSPFSWYIDLPHHKSLKTYFNCQIATCLAEL